MYLFEDVFRGQKRDEFFEGCFDNKYWYSGVCAEFEKKGFGIFNNEIVTKMDKEIEKQSQKASDAE